MDLTITKDFKTSRDVSLTKIRSVFDKVRNEVIRNFYQHRYIKTF